MKTAMQELLENLQKQFDEQIYPIRIDGTYFLDKEKEQRIKDFKSGMEAEFDIFYKIATNQNK